MNCFRKAQSAIAAGSALVVMSLSAPSNAHTCTPPSDEVHYLPKKGSVAPSNVAPRVLVRLGGPYVQPLPSELDHHSEVICERAGAKSTIPTRATARSGFRYIEIEHVPERPLPSGATCHLKEGPDFIVGERIDSSPPRTRGLLPGGVFGCWENSWGRCVPGTGELQLEFSELRDSSSEGQITVEVWTAALGETIDYETSPEAISLSGKLGTLRDCDKVGNFVFPPADESIQLGVRLVDLAGNRTEPFEATLQGAPAARFDWKGGPSNPLTPLAPLKQLPPPGHSIYWWLTWLLGVPLSTLVLVLVYRELSDQ